MPRLRALTSSATRKVGEEFDANELETRLLCAPDGLGGPKAELVDRAMNAEPETTKQGPSKDETIDSKRRYLRRDMRAQS